MKRLSTLFESNPKRNIKIEIDKRGAVHYINETDYFNGDTVLSIINFVNSMHFKYKTQNVPIFFEFPNPTLRIQDKLAFVMFECICYSLKKERRRVYVYWSPVDLILTQGVFSSPLQLLNTHTKKTNDKFVDKFKLDMYKNHFRKVIKFNKTQDLKSNYLGKFQQEVELFLKIFDLSEARIDRISEVIIELVGNAGEHGDSDCLVDIDITEDHKKTVEQVEQKGQFYGINITILSFSDKLIGDDLKSKIIAGNFDADRYKYLSEVYGNHLEMIENSEIHYTEEYFWNIAALQDKISGRNNKSITGGTGLTVLINSLQREADNDSCYMLSGSKVIFFRKEFIEYDSNMWLGFNSENDFLNYEPDESILGYSPVHIPGTAYNLNFVMKKEENI